MTATSTKIGVMIATPLRTWHGPQDLPRFVGAALHEIAKAAITKTQADIDFYQEASKYAFTFVAAIGGLCRARNTLVHEFLRDPAQTWLIWCDADAMVTADVLLRLLSHRQPNVGALYCTRGPAPHWVATFMPAAEYQPEGDGLIQVAELGGGIKCIHRKVFEELARIHGDHLNYKDRDTGELITGFYQNVVNDRDLLSEDYFFDMFCRASQIPILADTKLQIHHWDDSSGTFSPPEGAFPPIPTLTREDAQ